MSNENENWLFFVLCADRGSATTRQQRQRRRRQRQKQIQRRRSSSSSLPLFRSIERSSSKITKMYLFFSICFCFCLCACMCVCVCVCARIQTNSFGHLERTLYGLLFLSCPMTLSLSLSDSLALACGAQTAQLFDVCLLLLMENQMQLIFICRKNVVCCPSLNMCTNVCTHLSMCLCVCA